MDKQMNKRLKLGLIVIMLVLVAIFAAYWAIIISEPQTPIFQQRRLPPLPQGFIPGDFELFYIAFAIISSVNIALLVILTLVYIDIFSKTHSEFTVGLLIFALVFLVKDVTSSPLLMAMLGFRAYGLGPFEFLPGLLEFFALSILLYLSNK
jgi:hypothetical protein